MPVREDRLKLSVVSTLYRSEPYVADFVRRASAAAEKVTPDYEIILVVDGSPDDSLGIALKLMKSFPRLIVVDLSRNFGHFPAILEGLSRAKGDLVFLIDSDLEEEPELLQSFHDRLSRGDGDVVFGYMESRKGGVFERAAGHVFYRIFELLTDYRVPRNALVARLMTHRYVQSLLLHGERQIFLGGLCHITGFVQVGVPVKKHSKGSTTYTLGRKIAAFAHAITSFTDRPLRMIFLFGLGISSLAIFAAIVLVIMKLWFFLPVPGWTSILVSVWFLNGLSILFIGVIGIYLSSVFVETKARPRAIVRQIYDSSGKGE